MKRIYFIGIGGISMSGLAKYAKINGFEVFGSDIKESEEIKALKKMGVRVFLEQKKENIKKCLPLDLVVYTSAISPGSPGDAELKEAKRLKIKILKRAEYIGELTKKYFTLAVAGMHGKTTTTAMLGKVLKDLKMSPLVLLGGEYSEFNFENVEIPKNKPKFLVLEACEYDESFLKFDYKGAIILNIEEEHLDYFKNGLPQIINTFRKFAQKKGALFLVAHDEKNIKEALRNLKKKIVYYSEKDLKKEKISLKIPGLHNRLNALAVVKLCEFLGLDKDKVKKSLLKFKGVKRRQEFKGFFRGVPIFDDYAHHPTEIKKTLQALREKYKRRKIFLIFQPHQFTRTTLLFKDFIESLKLADKLVIIEVFGVIGRENLKNPKTSEDLVKALKKEKEVFYAKDYDVAERLIREKTSSKDLIILMGAGPLETLLEKLLNK